MATAKAEIPPAKGNQINDWPGRVRSVTGPFNFDPGPWSAIAFIILVPYNNSLGGTSCHPCGQALFFEPAADEPFSRANP